MNVLLAIDQSQASEKATRFVGRVFGNSKSADFSITLLHVVESLPEFVLDKSRDAHANNDVYRQVTREWEASTRADGERLLQTTSDRLVEAGIDRACLKTQLVVKDSLPEAKKVAAALAIIDAMKRGNCDVVCVGRRGTSAAESVFVGSVAEKILREAQGKTVWVVD